MNNLSTNSEGSSKHEKLHAAIKSLDFIEQGMLVGLGSGSTVACLIPVLAKRVEQGLIIKTVATSAATEKLAVDAGIVVIDFDGSIPIDLTIDGADEVDENLNLIKGGGGALLREKIIASASRREIIIVDSSKMVTTLGAVALPIEVIKLGWRRVAERLALMGSQPVLRTDTNGGEFITDEGNFILDCTFESIKSPESLANELDHIVGLVEHGLFVGLVDVVIIGMGTTTRLINRVGSRTI